MTPVYIPRRPYCLETVDTLPSHVVFTHVACEVKNSALGRDGNGYRYDICEFVVKGTMG